MFALISEIFSDGERDVGGLAAHEGRLIASCDDDDGAFKALLAKIILEELLHFAATFTDQANDGDVGVGVFGHHGEEDGFTDTGAGEDAHTLALAGGEESVDGADAEVELRAHALAGMWRRRFVFEGDGVSATWQRPFAIDGLREAIDDAAEPAFVREDDWVLVLYDSFAAKADAFEGAEGHEERVFIAETDDFAGNVRFIIRAKVDDRTDREI